MLHHICLYVFSYMGDLRGMWLRAELWSLLKKKNEKELDLCAL